jgi:RES domain-containing protein
VTTPRLLPKPLTVFRIGDPAGTYPIFSAEGARRTQGRWHEAGDRVIYASEYYSTAMLEKLVHWNGLLPPNQHFIEITIPEGVSYEIATPDIVPGWHEPGGEAARRFGHDWYVAQRSAVLLVPSVVARPERNLVINTTHPDFPRIEASLETPVWWDNRLFDRS